VAVGWNMFLAMVLGMVIGMIAGLLLWLPLGVLFGAMEVMLPTMFGGMLSGMVIGMWSAMSTLGVADAAAIGGVCGLVSIVFIWILNNAVRGPRTYTAEGS
jgi:hypothetical protein